MDSKKMLSLLGAMSVMAATVPATAATSLTEAKDDGSASVNSLKLYSGAEQNVEHWRNGHWSHGSHGSHGSHVSHSSGF